jgi:DHA3 family macrolide efflux protein-like MFS transporter
VRSALSGIVLPAAGAVIPTIVPDGQLMRVNGINETIGSAALLISPLVTGTIYDVIGLVPIFIIDVGTSLLAAGILAFLPKLNAATEGDAAVSPSPATEADEAEVSTGSTTKNPSVLADLMTGLRYVAGHAQVRWLLGIYAIAMLFAAAPSFLTPLMMARTFGPDVWRLTANEMFWAGGSLAVGLVMVAVGPRIKRHLRVIMMSLVATGALSLAVGFSTNMWLYLALLAGIGIAFGALTIPEFTLLQQTVDPQMLGRVFGLVSIITSVAMSTGMAVLGPLADRVSVEEILQVSGAALLVVIALLLLAPGLRALLAQRPVVAQVDEALTEAEPGQAAAAVVGELDEPTASTTA